MTEPVLAEPERAALIEQLARTRHGAGLEGAPGVEAELRSPVCGDRFTVRVAVDDGVVSGIRWDGHGCVVSTAAASVLADLAPGTPVEAFQALLERYSATLEAGAAPDPALGDAEVFAGIGRYPLRAGCAALAWRAADAALASQGRRS